MRFHRGAICLLDEENEHLVSTVVKNYSPEETQRAFSGNLTMKRHDCLVTKVARTGTHIVLEDSEADPRVTPTDRKITSFYKGGSGFYSAFCGPLKIKNNVIGVIAMWH